MAVDRRRWHPARGKIYDLNETSTRGNWQRKNFQTALANRLLMGRKIFRFLVLRTEGLRAGGD